MWPSTTIGPRIDFDTRETDDDGCRRWRQLLHHGPGGSALPRTIRTPRRLLRGSLSRQFKTLWFDDDLDTDLKVKATHESDRQGRGLRASEGANDLYGPDRTATTDVGTRTRATHNVNLYLADAGRRRQRSDERLRQGRPAEAPTDDLTTPDDETTHQLEACALGVRLDRDHRRRRHHQGRLAA